MIFSAHLCSTLRSLNPLNHWTVGAGSPSIVNVINPFVPSLGNMTRTSIKLFPSKEIHKLIQIQPIGIVYNHPHHKRCPAPGGMLVRRADELRFVSSAGLQRGALVGFPVLNNSIRAEDNSNDESLLLLWLFPS